MAGRQMILLAVAAVAMGVVGVRATPTIGDCTHNRHCEQNCCLVGFSRFSIPSCSSRADVGASCRPGQPTPFSSTLHYPNGATVKVEEAYFGMCPCRSGLVCTTSATCQVSGFTSTSVSFEDNSVSSEEK